jgi:hypothetical protein
MSLNVPVINKAARGRGRPKISLTNRFRVVVWSHFVKQASGASEAKELQKLLSEKRLGPTQSSGLWSRYLRGEMLPQGGLSSGTSSLVSRIELAGIASGSSRIFSHPVWDLMDFKKVLTPVDLRATGLKLDKKLCQLFVLHHAVARGGDVADRFWYQCPPDKSKVMERSRSIDLDGLAVSVICARMAYLAQNRILFTEFLSLACDFLKMYSGCPLYSEKRMKSVLLVMEGSIQNQVRAAIRTPQGDYDFSLNGAESVTTLRQDWEHRTKSHSRTLSKSSLAVFKQWLRWAYGDADVLES